MDQDINEIRNRRNVDSIFYYFDKKRNGAISHLNKNIDSFIDELYENDKFITVDRRCLCNMGRYIVLKHDEDEQIEDTTVPMLGQQYRCINCEYMSRIIDLTSDASGKIFDIEYGSHIGRKISVSNIASCSHVNSNRVDIQRLISQNNNMKLLQLDEFTNYLLGTWCLNSLFDEFSMTHIPKLYTGFICGNEEYLIEETSENNIETLFSNEEYQDDDTVDPEICESMIFQLMITLKVCSTSDFCHGKPCTEYLFYKELPGSRNIKYKNKTIKTNIIFKMKNSPRSSMTKDKEVRLFNNKWTSLEVADAVKLSGIMGKGETFTLSRKNKELSRYVLDLGICNFQTSFNFYFFMTSLMQNKQFYSGCMKSEKLKHIWVSMWKEEDLKSIEKYNINETQTTYDKLYNLLSEKTLITNILDNSLQSFIE